VGLRGAREVKDSGAGASSLDAAAASLLSARLDSYRRVADVFHAVLSEQSLDRVLERIADALEGILTYDTLTIYAADEQEGRLTPVLARDEYAAEILESTGHFDEGITGWAVVHREPVLANEAHLDPRTVKIPGTPEEPEALISVPLVARDSIKGALNIYRTGEGRGFSREELELATRFADAAALALDNAQSRAALERLAQTDSLTGLYNHRFFHERLRAEVQRISRVPDSLGVLMLDIDDFKRLNDIYGHAVGDQVLIGLSQALSEMTRGSDVVCRLGGEELAVIMPSCDITASVGLGRRFMDALAEMEFGPVGRVTVSIGIAAGPDHAMNPRELAACSESAMMTAKARGKNALVVYDAESSERPESTSSSSRDVRSISHLKVLQSLAGKLNRLIDVSEIGMMIAVELRSLIDYHSCRVYLADGEDLIPIALLASYEEENPEDLRCKFGEGITGRAAATAQSLLIPNALECDFAADIPGTEDLAESIVAVPLTYGARVIGVIVLSKLGIAQFDEADVSLMEVLGGNVSVALENARLYEAQRREAETAKSLLEFSDAIARARSPHAAGAETVRVAARLLGAPQSALWLQDETTGEFRCDAHVGYDNEAALASIVECPIAKANGERFIASRPGPFVVTPSVAVQYFSLPEGVMPRAMAVSPLRDVGGWLEVSCPERSPPGFTQDGLRLLAGLSHQTSVAIQRARLHRDQRENVEIANSLLEFGRELATAEGLDEVLHRVVKSAARVLGVAKIAAWLEEPETGDLYARATCGYSEEETRGLLGLRVPADLARQTLGRREPFVVSPEAQRNLVGRIVGAEGMSVRHVYAVAPLSLEGGRVGSLTAAVEEGASFEFSDRRLRLLAGMANQAKVAIASTQNFESLEETFLSTVEALANALEAKDENSSSHARDIRDASMELGTELGLGPRILKRLELAALFHDIGKIGIPSQILLKPGPLSLGEREVLERHPERGERILAPIARLEDVRPIVRACHERFDGRGYPDGLGGEEIPIEARIIFVCEAFHAMTTDRPYRNALEQVEACRRLTECAGTQFDPAVVAAFLRVLERGA
jgi:diguanylate cyclase (GGDEF)-like protein